MTALPYGERHGMTADEVIDLRKTWARYRWGFDMPAATVLAERDWSSYVRAMTAMVPASDTIVWPTQTEVAWAWPDGVMVVFAEPIELHHVIISTTDPVTGQVTKTDPHMEAQRLAALVIMPQTLVPVETPEGVAAPDLLSSPVVYIESPDNVISGHWLPGITLTSPHGLPESSGISESTKFTMSLIAALGHRLTHLAAPLTAGRGERRRVERELPSLRVLQLSSGATVEPGEHSPGSVDWSHRWMVRGHWRQQPCGTRRQLRRLKWIDPYVKGPEDKPLDVRPTIWRTG